MKIKALILALLLIAIITPIYLTAGSISYCAVICSDAKYGATGYEDSYLWLLTLDDTPENRAKAWIGWRRSGLLKDEVNVNLYCNSLRNLFGDRESAATPTEMQKWKDRVNLATGYSAYVGTDVQGWLTAQGVTNAPTEGP